MTLLDSSGRWLRSLGVDLFPWDAGTEEGTDFSLSPSVATSPQGTIESIRGTGKFTTERIASLSFTLQSVSATRSVAENTAAGENIGAPVVVADSGAFTYSLGGTDASSFDIDATTGQLQTKAALDYETRPSYELTVTATDAGGSTDITVAVDVINVVELLPAVSGPASVSYAENRAVRAATYTASSLQDRDLITWTLSGDDAAQFSVDSPPGVLRFHIDPVVPNVFLQLPDFEDPADADADNVYSVTLAASDGTDTVTLDVSVTVGDGNEAGTLTLSTTRPRLGEALTATPTDQDGITGPVAYRWERSAGRNAWVTIAGAHTGSYTPTAAETGRFLRVTATYTDRHRAQNTAAATAAEVVTAQLLSGLTVTTTDSLNSASDDFPRQLKPAFDAETLHYAIGCVERGDTMTLTPSAARGARLAVNGVQVASGSAVDVPVHGESDVLIAVSGGDGASTTYTIHCLTGVLWRTTAIKQAGATGIIEDLIMFNRDSYLAIVDNNAVPRFHRKGGGSVHYFRVHRVGVNREYRYSHLTDGPGTGRPDTAGWAVLDQQLEQIAGPVETVRPLTHTDNHDFRILENGNYLLAAYEPATRDFSGLTFEHDNISDTQPQKSSDSAIQVVHGQFPRATFTWSSWGNIPLEDCSQHRFPVDYAHINSLQMVDGQIIASFRGCSTVLRIDPDHPDAHKVVWRLGRSNLSAAEWEARDSGPPPLAIVNDPEGEFCGQHAAWMLPNGNLILYDNGVACVIDPWTREESRQSDVYSRVVEYAIDLQHGEAVFRRDHSLHSRKNLLGFAGGHVEALDNGDWLISWGRLRDPSPGPDESITQVDPDTGEEKFALRMPNDSEQAQWGGRAVPLSPAALAAEPVALEAVLAASSHTSVFNSGAPQVVVAFNRPRRGLRRRHALGQHRGRDGHERERACRARRAGQRLPVHPHARRRRRDHLPPLAQSSLQFERHLPCRWHDALRSAGRPRDRAARHRLVRPVSVLRSRRSYDLRARAPERCPPGGSRG